MYGIAAAAGQGGRKDIFWLDKSFTMHATYFTDSLPALGGVFTTAPTATSSLGSPPLISNPGTLAPRIVLPPTQVYPQLDVFGLGTDYAMYHQALWGNYGSVSGWQSLGGTFMSAPAAIAWKMPSPNPILPPPVGSRIDVFGLGTDYAMYHNTNVGGQWLATWEPLGGAFSSKASPVSQGPGSLDVFARGADFTLRHRSHNGSAWTSDWQNLGGNLASEPSAVSWGPGRLDIFAVANDSTLWHIWWDGSIWNQWESLGGRYTSSPSAVTWGPNRLDVFVVGNDSNVYHHWFDGYTWHRESLGGPIISSPTAISTAPNLLDVFAPGPDGGVYWTWFDGTKWQGRLTPQGWFIGGMALPSQYRIGLDFVTCNTPRSLVSDTDTAAVSLAVGNWPPQSNTQSMGDVGGTHPSQSQTNLLNFTPVTVELCEVAVFHFSVVNNSSADQRTIDADLTKAGEDLVSDGSKAVAQGIATGLGAIAGTELLGTLLFPVIGTLVGALFGYLFDELANVIFANCDGFVVADLITLPGQQLQTETATGSHTVTPPPYPGTDSPTGCGGNSVYTVIWSAQRA